ncbi:Imm63 family immunity protein [Gordonia sp. NPDC003376]
MAGGTAAGGDDAEALDARMRGRIEDLARRMDAGPGDAPELRFVRDDGHPSCWSAPDGSWHLTIRERAHVLSDRSTTDSVEFLRIVAETIADLRARRMYPSGTPDDRRAAWATQYASLTAVDRTWARRWLETTRSDLVAAGADRSTLALLPAGG